MKHTYLLLIASCCALPAMAQKKTDKFTDSLVSRWSLELNLKGGGASQSFTTANTLANYPQALNANTGSLKYTNGYSYGADAEIGFFFGKKRHWGLGTGFMYMQQQGDVTLNDFKMESAATDANGNIYSIQGQFIRAGQRAVPAPQVTASSTSTNPFATSTAPITSTTANPFL